MNSLEKYFELAQQKYAVCGIMKGKKHEKI